MVIANRVLILRQQGRDVEIPIRISAPVNEKLNVWGCRYEIGWPNENRVVTAWGFDSIQALLVAMQMIGAEIYSSSYHKAGTLFWEAPGKGYGFPVAPTLRDLLQGDDEKYL